MGDWEDEDWENAEIKLPAAAPAAAPAKQFEDEDAEDDAPEEKHVVPKPQVRGLLSCLSARSAAGGSLAAHTMATLVVRQCSVQLGAASCSPWEDCGCVPP